MKVRITPTHFVFFHERTKYSLSRADSTWAFRDQTGVVFDLLPPKFAKCTEGDPSKWDASDKFKAFAAVVKERTCIPETGFGPLVRAVSNNVRHWEWWEAGYNTVAPLFPSWRQAYQHPDVVPAHIAKLAKVVKMKRITDEMVISVLEYPDFVMALYDTANTPEEWNFADTIVNRGRDLVSISMPGTNIPCGCPLSVFTRFNVDPAGLLAYMAYLERNEAIYVDRSLISSVAQMMYMSNELKGPEFDRFPIHMLSMYDILSRKFANKIGGVYENHED